MSLSRHRVVVVAVAAAYVPLLLLLGSYLWSRPHYQFFPIVVAGVAMLIASRWPSLESGADEQSDQYHRPTRMESWLLLFGMLLLSGAIAVYSPWLAGVSAIITMAGLLIHAAGVKTFRKQFFGPWCLLWLIIPLPFQLDSRLVERLQAMTSSVASSVLDLVDIRHLMSGNILEFPERTMLVEEACSGIHSLFAIVACVALYVAWARRPMLHVLLLLAGAIFWAVVMNTGRVLTVAMAYARFDVDLASGWIHEALGMVVFALALLATASMDQLLLWLGAQMPYLHLPKIIKRRKHRRKRMAVNSDKVAADETPESPQQVLEPAKLRRGTAWESWLVAALFGGLLLLQVAVWLLPDETKHNVSLAAEQLNAESLPEELNGWSRLDYQLTTRDVTSSFGEFSKTWVYQAPICKVSVSFDYPFEGWHEVTRCYRSHGWNVINRQAGSEEKSNISFVEVELTKPSGEHGYLLFASLSELGDPLVPPRSTTSLKDKMFAKLSDGPLGRLLGRTPLANHALNLNTYQFQTFVATNHRLSAGEREDVRKQFLQLGNLFQERCRQSP